MGSVHANKYVAMPDVTVQVYDLDTPKLEAFCAQRSLRACSSLDELIGESDAVDVCLPTTGHVTVAMAALRARKPTLVEKPMAREVSECQALADAALESETILVPAHVVRFFPEYKRAHELVKSGEVGTPASVRLRRGGGPPKAEWFLDIDASGGILLDLAVHEFDWLLWTLGPAKSVSSRSVRQIRGSSVTGDYALTLVEFFNGCVAHVESTWMDPQGFRATIDICGSKGMIEFDSRQNPSLRASPSSPFAENNYILSDDPYYQQLRAFVDSAKGDRLPAVTLQEGLEAVRLASAAITSATSGQTVWL